MKTPCIDICVIHRREGLCVGCLRTADEIAAWSSLTDDERDALMDELPSRAARLKRRAGGRTGNGERRRAGS
ncbi:DUF1289 domain-containing protein [Roseitranquillus sediminis]|uniref:DUF1289 domain-containing protein n=1 Tax=Roseitranquillus sediminis TaxID=2809051 RepID=UPI001D0C2F7E|nr:DUF1289 domain-containing protein [Roseitranquillus sediminis]MBM9594316.1 DUF1289 domain-containing protein [Roseitranquillus sediminis]